MKFRNRLKQARETRGLSQAALAIKLGVSQGTVGNWESGAREPSLEKAIALAETLNISLDWLFCVKQNTSVQPTEETKSIYIQLNKVIPQLKELTKSLEQVSTQYPQ